MSKLTRATQLEAGFIKLYWGMMAEEADDGDDKYDQRT